MDPGRSYERDGALAGRSYGCMHWCLVVAGAFLRSLLPIWQYILSGNGGRSGKELLVEYHLVVVGRRPVRIRWCSNIEYLSAKKSTVVLSLDNGPRINGPRDT
jgi:hypothetical protein